LCFITPSSGYPVTLAVLPDTVQRFSSGTKYIRLMNPVPYLEEEEEEEECTRSSCFTFYLNVF
jgi:hypothetical protein